MRDARAPRAEPPRTEPPRTEPPRAPARALDDVSDHLGEMLRHADELLADWSRFGAQVRAQVEREVATIGDTVDGAVARATSAGVERALTDRLGALTAELGRLEQRAKAAARAVQEQRANDRRILWIVVGGVALANALLIAVLVAVFARGAAPAAAPQAEPVRIEPAAATPTDPAPAPAAADPGAAAGSAGSASAPVPDATSGAANAAPTSATPAVKSGGAVPSAAAPGAGSGSAHHGALVPHKKLP